jgi:hypothetical protein
MIGGAVVQAFNAQTGGTQYTDLSLDAEGTLIVDHVNSSDASDGLQLGQIPPFYGPDDVWQMWLSANGGPRVLVTATDLGLSIQSIGSDTASVRADLTDFQATKGAANGLASLDGDGLLTASQRWTPSFSIASATDVNLASLADKDLLQWDAATSKFKRISTAVSWTNLTVTGSIVTSVTVARARLIPVTGQVEVQLFLNINAITGQTLLTLPTQFRPSVQVTVPAMQNSNSGNNGRFEFRTDGTVVNSFVNSSPSFCGCHVVYTP